MRRPLVSVVSAYAVGLLVGDFLHAPLVALFSTTFVLLIVALAWSRGRAWLVFPLLFLTGWVNFACQTEILDPADLRLVCKPEPEILTLEGVLVRTPEPRIHTSDDGRQRTRSLSLLQVVSAQRKNSGWTPAHGEVLVITPSVLPPHFRKGQRVSVTGVLSTPPGPVAPGLFDYASYLRRQNIYFQLRAANDRDWTLAGPLVPAPIEDVFIAWAKKVMARGMATEDEPLRLLWSMGLGWRAAIEGEVYEPFIKTGTMHIFAISGLHIAFIAGILIAAFRAVRLPRAACGLLVLPLIWFYTGATGWQPSAVRATVMMSVIIGGWAMARPSDLINSLFAAAFVILLWDPQQLFGASFQLSFCVVLSIGILLPGVERWRDALLKHDPMLPEDLVPIWKRRGLRAVRWMTNGLAVSLAACLGSIPLTAYYFHLFSPITLLANMLIVPLSSLALACTLGSLVCGNWLWPFTEAFNNSAWLFMSIMVWLSDRWAALPHGHYYVRSLTFIQCLAYYVVLFGAVSGVLLRNRTRLCALGITALLLASSLLWGKIHSPRTVTILPVDGGLVVYSQTAEGDMLVDCGKTNGVERLVIPLLHSRGINRLDRMVLTHGDLRHVGGVLPLDRELKPREICASEVRFRSPTYRKVIEDLDRRPKPVRRIESGDQAGCWRVLHPMTGDKFSQADDGPLVLAGTINGVRLLLLSDLGRAGQEVLAARVEDLHADIVVTGLPTSGDPLRNELLERIKPRLIIVGDSETPTQERAGANLLQRLKASGASVISTAQSGVTVLEFGGSGWSARAMDGMLVSGNPEP